MKKLTLIILLFWVSPLWAATIYVDDAPGTDCSGNYSVASRNCSGLDGDSYNTISEAVNNANLGDTIDIREHDADADWNEAVDLRDLPDGSNEGERITIQAHTGETVIIDGSGVGGRGTGFFSGSGGTANVRDYITIDGFVLRDWGRCGVEFTNSGDSDSGNQEGSTNIIIQNLTVSNSGWIGIEIMSGGGGSYTETENIQILDCTVYDSAAEGIKGDGDVSGEVDTKHIVNMTVSGCTVYGNGEAGIHLSDGTQNSTIEYNESYNNNYDGIDFVGNNGSVMRGNYVHNNTRGGIWFYRSTNCTIEYNLIENNTGIGIEISGDWGGAAAYVQNKILYNIFDTNSGDAGIQGWSGDYNTFTIVGNTFINENVGIYLKRPDHTIKNNIFYHTTGSSSDVLIRLDNTSGYDADFIDGNLYYETGLTNPWYWGGSQSTFAGWQSASGMDDNGLEDNPDFTNAGGGDYTLTNVSPAIDNGLDLADDDLDDALDPDSTWPSSVTTLDQDDHGSGWDIGAYEYGCPNTITTYYVRDDGDDDNCGDSDAQAWQTIAKVNATSFNTGDDVYFKCGDEWNAATDDRLKIDWSGTSGNRAVIGAYYGSGTVVTSSNQAANCPNLPIIDGQCDTAHAGTECGTEGSWTGKTPGNVNDALIEVNDVGGSGVQDYVTVEFLRTENSAAVGIRVNGNGDDPWTKAQNLIVQYCEVNWTASSGIFFYRTEDSFIQYNHVWETDIGQSLDWPLYNDWGYILGGTQNNLNLTIRYNLAHDGGGEGIGSYKNNVGTIIEYNTLYNAAKSGIYVDRGVDEIYRYNLVYGDRRSDFLNRTTARKPGELGIDDAWQPRGIELGDEGTGGDTSGILVYGNLIANCYYGIRVGHNKGVLTDGVLYNNTMAGCYYGISFYDTSVGTVTTDGYVKNNIVAYTESGGTPTDQTASTNIVGVTFDYNCWGGDTPDTWADQANDVDSDPLLSKSTGWRDSWGSIDGSEFELGSSSPCIDAGTNLGASYDDALESGNIDFTASPIDVNTVLQGDYGSEWEIGAFVSYDCPFGAASPLCLELHPRLFFIPESHRTSYPSAPGITVSEMETKLKTYYLTEFQDFIDEMDLHYGDTISSKEKLYLTNDGIGFAFLYMMDPANITGFTATYTKAQYGAKAYSHLIELATNVRDETDDPDTLTAWLDTRYLYSDSSDEGGPVNLALAVIYDWLGPSYFSSSEKELFLDAMDNAYDLTISAIASKIPYLNNVATGMIHNGYYPAIAMYGDLLDTRLDTIIDDVEDTCLGAVRDMGNHIFDNSCGWAEGITLYWYESAVHVALFYGGLTSALGEDLFDTTKFLKDSSYFSFFSTLPFPVDGDYHWLKFDDDDPDYQWDVIDVTVRKTFYILAGMLNYTNPDLAGLAKWMYEDSGWSDSPSLDVREEYVLFNFFGGMNHVTSKTPSAASVPLSRKNGEQYSFKSTLTGDSASLVTFWAQEYFPLAGGHNHRDWGSFQIHKYGDLAIQRSIAKAFSGGNIAETKYNMFYNTIGVYELGDTVGSYNLMSYRSSGFDEDEILPTSAPYLTDGDNHIGTVLGDDLDGIDYDYVDYDLTNSWDSSKVDYAEREFVYLRSQGGTNDEYVVVFDRVNATDADFTKYWLLHASFEPDLLTNGGTPIVMAATNYPLDPDTLGGRWINTSSSPTTDNTIKITQTYEDAHGVLFNKTLEPDTFQINKVGGSGHYWDDAEGKEIWTDPLSEEEKYYRGTYTMQIESTTNQQYDTFLNIMQFGDSTTLTSMADVTKITAIGSNGNMVGVLIKDSTANRVVLFNESKRASVDKVEATIAYSITTTATSSYHLLTNVEASTAYTIYRSGTLIDSGTSSNAGTIEFSDSVAVGSYTYSVGELALQPVIGVTITGSGSMSNSAF